MFKHYLRQYKRKLDEISINLALFQQGLLKDIKKLRSIVPDISQQESCDFSEFLERSLKEKEYLEIKRRGMHAFQCRLMLTALKEFQKNSLMVADIGDSAGTHMLYLRSLAEKNYHLETISVNLDPMAIQRIKARGLNAILKRAEDIQPEDLGDKEIDLFTSFEMLEHLHCPTIFLQRLAKNSQCNHKLITVPFQKDSRVGLHYLKQKRTKKVTAEIVHIFELSPKDWELLFLFAGWRIKHSEIYYQYPRFIPIVSWILCKIWRKYDFEGFWGVILEKDKSYSDLYKDWPT